MDTPYRFTGLERFTREDVQTLNRVHRLIAPSGQISRMLKAVAETLMEYDIYTVADTDVRLTVKSVSEITQQQNLRFTQPVITIGRSSDSDLSLKSPLVSKKHAELFQRGSDYFLRDLRSNNGTFLNQVRLQPGAEVVLKNDDIVRIEPFEILIGRANEGSKKPLEFGAVATRVAQNTSASPQIGIVVQMLPTRTQAMLVIDTDAARWLIQKVITGQSQIPSAAWSDVETGLLEYLACRVLSALNPTLKELRFVLERVITERGGVASWFENRAKYVEVTITADSEIGPLCALLYLPPPPAEVLLPRADVHGFLQRADWLHNLSYLFSINLGNSYLTVDQIQAIDEGDVILLDRTEVTLQEERPAGKVEIISKYLQQGTIRGSLLCSAQGNSTIAIDSLNQEGLKRMTDANKKTDNAQAESQGVISAIEVPVTVEFARISFTLEELASVKEGQIIEMEKLQPELVDLSVDGKVIGNGKLVDVEGKLGVRILKMIKTK